MREALVLICGFVSLVFSGCGGGSAATTAAPTKAPSPVAPTPATTAAPSPWPAPPACPSPPAPPAPTQSTSWDVPVDGIMHYSFVQDRETVKDTHPECVVDWGDIDDDGVQKYNLVGAKIPDRCCENPAWQVDPLNLENNGARHTCPIVFAGYPGWRMMNQMRLYLGCTDGKVVGAEDCIPSGLQYYTKDSFLGNSYNYPMDASVACSKWTSGTPDDCGCSKRARFNNGAGCYLASAQVWDMGQKFKGGVNATMPGQPDSGPAADTGVRGAVFVKINGTCPVPTPAPPPPAVTKPANAKVQYSMTFYDGDFSAHPECKVDFGNLNEDGTRTGYNYIGGKFPESCCTEPAWIGNQAPETLTDANGDQQTCYIKKVEFPGWRQDQRMRLYLGCVGDQLVGSEDCVPSEVKLYDKEEYLANSYTYPMNATYGDTTWKTASPDECGCSKHSRFNNGPGCYLAYATAFDYGQKFKGGAAPTAPGDPDSGAADDTKKRGVVFVKIEGQCPGSQTRTEFEIV